MSIQVMPSAGQLILVIHRHTGQAVVFTENFKWSKYSDVTDLQMKYSWERQVKERTWPSMWGQAAGANRLAMAVEIYFLPIYQHCWLKITVGKIQWHLRGEAITFSDTSMAFTKNWGGQESFSRNTVPTVFPRPLGFTQNWTEILPLAVLFSSEQLPSASGAPKVCLHILHIFSHRLSFSTFSLSHSKPHSLTFWKKMIRHTDKVTAPRLSSVSKEPYGRYYYGA